MAVPAALLDVDGTLVDTNYHDEELRDAGAVAVFESRDDLIESLDETPFAALDSKN